MREGFGKDGGRIMKDEKKAEGRREKGEGKEKV